MKLDIQLFGGRGATFKLSGIPKNKRKKFNSLNENIKEHEQKIKYAKEGRPGYRIESIPHWEHEIRIWKRDREKLERKYKK